MLRGMVTPRKQLDSLAESVLHRLLARSQQLVLAESCTAGLISATLARIPGASAVLAGSAVVYQLQTKTAWLQIPAALLEQSGAVSEEVARLMAAQVLQHTPQATLSLSITGHLGPDAPAHLDGIAWVAVADQHGRLSARRLELTGHVPTATGHGRPLTATAATALRRRRQTDAVRQALQLLLEELSFASP